MLRMQYGAHFPFHSTFPPSAHQSAQIHCINQTNLQFRIPISFRKPRQQFNLRKLYHSIDKRNPVSCYCSCGTQIGGRFSYPLIRSFKENIERLLRKSIYHRPDFCRKVRLSYALILEILFTDRDLSISSPDDDDNGPTSVGL